MQIYTSECGGVKLANVRKYGLGIMLSPLAMSKRDYKGIPLALDNGAFRAWTLGYPFIESAFVRALAKGYELGWPLTFIVCPDLVAQGLDSLIFSMEWARRRPGCKKLALAVQDGLNPTIVHNQTADLGFSTIFVGGTKKWKWETAADWVSFAHEKDMKVHIGRCGTLKGLETAAALGVDSVDSSNFARNDSWHVLEQFGLGG